MLSTGETKVTMGEKLLSTVEAAHFLRVSPASVRRWSDSGLLPSRRIGRKRERRFTERDLEKFLTPGSSAPPARQDAFYRDVFVGGTRVPVHGHLAIFYNSDGARLRLSVPFLRDGLRLGQPCFLAAGGDEQKAFLDALGREPGVDVKAAIRDGSIRLLTGPGADAEAALAFWEQAMSSAVAAGPTLIRVVGDMVSVRTVFPSDQEVISYEVAYNGIAKRFPSVTLCQYDVRAFDGSTVFRALRAHPDLYNLGVASFLI